MIFSRKQLYRSNICFGVFFLFLISSFCLGENVGDIRELSLDGFLRKPTLLFFNGLDSDVNLNWSRRIKKEILEAIEFESYFFSKISYLELSPFSNTSCNDIKLRDELLRGSFHIGTDCCVILVSREGKELFRFNSLGASSLLLQKDFSLALEKCDKLEKFNNSSIKSLSLIDLKEYYSLAREVGLDSIVQEILSLNLTNNFFLVEKYRYFLEMNKENSKECRDIRKILLNRDPKNKEKLPFKIALIDFQEMSNPQKQKKLKDIVMPLKKYLNNFGKTDYENSWKIQMILAQLYCEANRKKTSLKYAKEALAIAPQDFKNDISQSLNYIQRRM